MKKRFLLLLMFAFVGKFLLASNTPENIAKSYILKNKQQFNLNDKDVATLQITDMYTEEDTKITHIWFQQTANKIGLKNSSIAVHLDEKGNIAYSTGNGILDFESKVNASNPTINTKDATYKTAYYLGVDNIDKPNFISKTGNKSKFNSIKNLSEDDIDVELLYFENGKDKFLLAYETQFFASKDGNYWSVIIDANSGELLKLKDQTIHCNIKSETEHTHEHSFLENSSANNSSNPSTSNNNSSRVNVAGYRVYPYNVEAPSFGSRQLLSGVEDASASPRGWHDNLNIDGTNTGATSVNPLTSYTNTRGNNVFAYQDKLDKDLVASAVPASAYPNGGAGLSFDYPINFNSKPDTLDNAKAAVTNLFYINNILHDISYKYGFTEVAGNFQSNNYGKGGKQGDFVLAEAHDGSLLNDGEHQNNANFSAPVDGVGTVNRGRMQMFLWDSEGNETLTVNTPSTIAGILDSVGGAAFNLCNFSVTGNCILVNDGSVNPTYACDNLVNFADVSGKIAIVDRWNGVDGTACTFAEKVLFCQQAGAIGVVIVNREDALISMAGNDPSLIIPAVIVPKATGDILKNNIANGLNLTIAKASPNNCIKLDACYDNATMAHEYTHGISIRLTGGPGNSSCLQNEEQGGEGWSDFMEFVVTHRAGDTKNSSRGSATYLIGEPTTGLGIRDYKYSYDMSVNPLTYDNVKDYKKFWSADPDRPNGGDSVTRVHQIGTVWATMLWDLYWNMIDVYGYDNNLYTGTGGNNKTLKLVMDGLKLQPCSPGFVDARNAILKADSILNGYANKCTIWQTFARRGLGWSSKQGSSNSSYDQTAAFDLPPFCNTTIDAKFGASATSICKNASVTFRDSTTGVPTSWSWDFPGGTPATSTLQNPVITYNTAGTYSVTLRAYNAISGDTLTKTNFITVTNPPVVNAGTDQEVCEGTTVTIAATGATTYTWSSGQTTSSFTNTATINATYIVTGTTSGCSGKDTVLLTVKPKPVVSFTPANPTICVGQNIDITASYTTGTCVWSTGGTTPTINVSPTTSTYYKVTITNNGCSKTDSVLVTVNALPTTNAGADQAICAGTTVNIAATGASTYTWLSGQTTANFSVTPATTTSYIVTGSNVSCSKKDTVVITVTPSPNVNAGADQSICLGASANLLATNATTYTWNTGQTTAGFSVSPTNTTPYIVTGFDATCSRKDTVVITVIKAPTNVVITAPNAVTSGSTINLSATSTGGNTYTWTGGTTPTNTANVTAIAPTVTTNTTQTYSVTVSNSDCPTLTKDTIKNITIAPILTAAFDSSINNNAVTVTSNTTPIGGASSVTWNFGDGTPIVSGANPPAHTYTANGTYTITMTVTNAAGQTYSATKTITIVGTPTKNIKSLKVFDVYPNPNRGMFKIEIGLEKSSNVVINIIDIEGRIMSNKVFGITKTVNQTMDLTTIAKGIYMIDLQVDNEHTFRKIVIE